MKLLRSFTFLFGHEKSVLSQCYSWDATDVIIISSVIINKSFLNGRFSICFCQTQV